MKTSFFSPLRTVLLLFFALFALACSNADKQGGAPTDGSVGGDSAIGGDSSPGDGTSGTDTKGSDAPPPSDSSVGDTTWFDAPPGFDSGSPDAPIGYALVILPSDTTVTLPGGAPTTVDYHAEIDGSDGSRVDVTSVASFSIDDVSIGTFAATTLTAKKSGKTNVRASAKGLAAVTTITVVDPVVIIVPPAPAGAPTDFGGPVDSSRAPSFVYPSDKTLVPPNMNTLEFHFMPGAGNTLFELAFKGTAVDLKVYFTCTKVGSGCVYSPDATVWTYLAEGGRGKDPVSYTLRGVDGASPGGVGVSATQTISFGLENIVGGIYYWNAGGGAVMRYEFGVTGKAAELYMNAPMAGAGTCVGCHVLARDGTRISLGLDIPSPAPYKVFDVATRALIYAQGTTFGGGSNFFSFSPDTKQIMTSNGIGIVLRDAKDGTAITDPLVAKGAMPDWSPDGASLVYASPASAPPCFGGFCGAPGVDSASIDVIKKAGGVWSTTASVLVPFGGQNNYYPTYSPDGAFVLFNRSPSNQNSFDAKDALVWVVDSAGSAAPIQLATSSTGGDSWPKWEPQVQKYKSGSLMWLTFSSRRAYGLRLASGSTAQIWMVGFDPDKAKAGLDPTGPAFWLPFQDMGSGNHIAQWVTKVERKPCSVDTECASGEVCRGGKCYPSIK